MVGIAHHVAAFLLIKCKLLTCLFEGCQILRQIRYALIDYKRLMELLHISTLDELRNSYKK